MSLEFLLSQGLGMGLGMGLMAVPSISIISHYFHKRRALASGIVFSGQLIFDSICRLEFLNTEKEPLWLE